MTSAANIKLYGCTLTVFINISLSRTYEVPPSPEYKNRAAAKEAAIRLALKERVLDLLTPAGFDPSAPPLTAAAASRLARAARGREPMDVDPPGGSSGASEGAAIVAGPVDTSAARSPQSKDAVSRLDEFVQDWVGPGCLPQYDIFRDERSEPCPLPLDKLNLLELTLTLAQPVSTAAACASLSPLERRTKISRIRRANSCRTGRGR